MIGILPQWGIDPIVYDLYGPLHKCLVPWAICPGWQYAGLIVVRKVGKSLVQCGFIPVATGNCCFQVLRYDSRRYSSKVMKGVFTDADQAFFALIQDCFDIGKPTCAKNGNEYFYVLDLSTGRVNYL